MTVEEIFDALKRKHNLTIEQIAVQINASRSSVYNWIRDNKIPLRRQRMIDELLK